MPTKQLGIMNPGHMTRSRAEDRLTIYTIGHSTRPVAEFIDLLKSNGVAQLVDIRTIPKSRHNPQFNSDELAASLRAAHIRYVHMKKLGGLRHARQDSINLGWRNASFRGYADYMQTAEFEAAIDRSIKIAAAHPTVLMCAEAVPWRCHRSLVADALTVRGIRVLEIIGSAQPKPHEMTSFARVVGTCITYPNDQGSLALDEETSNGN
jgi:uncharacterized protein (DUF488 family)